MGFNILYSSHEVNGQYSDVKSLLEYINAYGKSLELDRMQVDFEACKRVINTLYQQFPCQGDIEKLNPFKKVAYFTTLFIAESPIHTKFPEDKIGSLVKIRNYQNIIIAYQLAVDSLEGATILRSDKLLVTLENRIEVSTHSFSDLIEALYCNIGPALNTHFKMGAVLFEQLAYRYNPNASYKKLI